MFLLFVKMLLISSEPSPPFSLSSLDAEHLKQLSRRLKLKTPQLQYQSVGTLSYCPSVSLVKLYWMSALYWSWRMSTPCARKKIAEPLAENSCNSSLRFLLPNYLRSLFPLHKGKEKRQSKVNSICDTLPTRAKHFAVLHRRAKLVPVSSRATFELPQWFEKPRTQTLGIRLKFGWMG